MGEVTPLDNCSGTLCSWTMPMKLLKRIKTEDI